MKHVWNFLCGAESFVVFLIDGEIKCRNKNSNKLKVRLKGRSSYTTNTTTTLARGNVQNKEL